MFNRVEVSGISFILCNHSDTLFQKLDVFVFPWGGGGGGVGTATHRLITSPF